MLVLLGLLGFAALTALFFVVLQPKDDATGLSAVAMERPIAVPAAPARAASPPPARPDMAELIIPAPPAAEPQAPPAPVPPSAPPSAAGPTPLAQATAAVAPPAPSVPAPAAPAAVPTTAVLPVRGPRVAILVQDLGSDPAATRRAIIRLPAAIGLGFTPYGRDLPALVKAARGDGHEVWAGLPMQPIRYPAVSPGPQALLVAAPAAQNVTRLKWALEQVGPGVVGAYNIMGSAFTASPEALRPVMAELAQRRLLMLDGRSGPKTVVASVAGSAGVRSASNWRYLDAPPAQLDANLAGLVATAKRDGTALGFVEARPASVARIEAWAATLADQGVTLVPVSTLVR
jgi:polysaccharide deacetylase 2 family uncharacterized protein YibQ